MRGHRRRCSILDLNMPGGSEPGGDPAITRAIARTPQIVVLTMQDEPAFAREALQAGALGYVLKEAADEELVEGRAPGRRGRHLSPARARRPPRGGAATPAGRPTTSPSASSRSCG